MSFKLCLSFDLCLYVLIIITMVSLFWKVFNCMNLSRNKIIRRISALKLCVLTILLLVLFSFSLSLHKISYASKSQAVSSPLGAALKLIQENGKVHIDDLEILKSLSDSERQYELRMLRNSIKMLQKDCLNKSNSISCNVPNKESLLTLFTTWVYDEEKLSLNNRTLQNWRSLHGINVIVFSNCSKVKLISEQAGWTVLPVIREAAACPVLPDMFLTAQQKFRSTYYGYANGDLLFSDGLLKTLEKIFCEFDNDKQILIVGRRTNVNSSLLNDINSQLGEAVEKYAIRYGERFQPDALDYFITNTLFPWQTFLPLAVGRRGYDNWVLAYARLNNFTVIDASDSVTCLHQTLDWRGNYEGLHKGKYNDYNVEIIESQDVSMRYELWGRSSCAKWRTWVDLCDNIVLGKRASLAESCHAKLGSWFSDTWKFIVGA